MNAVCTWIFDARALPIGLKAEKVEMNTMCCQMPRDVQKLRQASKGEGCVRGPTHTHTHMKERESQDIAKQFKRNFDSKLRSAPRAPSGWNCHLIREVKLPALHLH